MSERTLACRVCGQGSGWLRRGQVLEHAVDYFDCSACGYVQTETPHWLEQAYSRAINDVDTGIMLRNNANVGKVISTLAALNLLDGRVVDHAGGYGILVRLLRDAGVDAYWADKYCENLLARGFEAGDQRPDLLTAFEVFEHLVAPLDELRDMLARAPHVLLSTELVLGDGPPAPDWWYLGPEHGQHIGFFRPRTLVAMAQTLGCHVASDGRNMHLFSTRPIPRAWSFMIQRSHRWHWFARGRLQPKTMSDFDCLRAPSPTGPSTTGATP